MPQGLAQRKLDSADVLLAAKLRSEGRSVERIAGLLGVRPQTIYQLINGHTYPELRDAVMRQLQTANPGVDVVVVDRSTKGGVPRVETTRYEDGSTDELRIDVSTPKN